MLVTRHFRTLAIAVSFAPAAPGAALARTEPQGTMHDARLRELYGLVVSPSDPARYWAHNDSGNPADLVALDRTGRMLARVGIRDAAAFDWEDIAAFTRRGQPYLAIAESGDNLRWRDVLEIVVVHEPAPRRGAAAMVSCRVAHGRCACACPRARATPRRWAPMRPARSSGWWK